jgi:hypothetical protein
MLIFRHNIIIIRLEEAKKEIRRVFTSGPPRPLKVVCVGFCLAGFRQQWPA